MRVVMWLHAELRTVYEVVLVDQPAHSDKYTDILTKHIYVIPHFGAYGIPYSEGKGTGPIRLVELLLNLYFHAHPASAVSAACRTTPTSRTKRESW